MRFSRVHAATAAAAITGAIAFAVPASAGTKTYAGNTDGGGKFAADVTIKEGAVKKIKSARAVNLPGECDTSGPQRLDVATPEPIKVNSKGKFNYEFVQPEFGNTTTVKGKFDGKEVNGTMTIDLHYTATDTLPEEDCHTDPLKFSGERGAKDQTQD